MYDVSTYRRMIFPVDESNCFDVLSFLFEIWKIVTKGESVSLFIRDLYFFFSFFFGWKRVTYVWYIFPFLPFLFILFSLASFFPFSTVTNQNDEKKKGKNETIKRSSRRSISKDVSSKSNDVNRFRVTMQLTSSFCLSSELGDTWGKENKKEIKN